MFIKSNKIAIFTTGGSLDKTYDLVVSDFIVGCPQVGEILQQSNVTIPIEIREFIRKDSLQITDEERRQLKILIESEPAKHIIVTHGTDTIHTTGQLLASISGKVIVLTGSMRPASFKDTDASFNIGSAVLAVQSLPEGTYVVMNGQVFDPFRMKKNMERACYENA